VTRPRRRPWLRCGWASFAGLACGAGLLPQSGHTQPGRTWRVSARSARGTRAPDAPGRHSRTWRRATPKPRPPAPMASAASAQKRVWRPSSFGPTPTCLVKLRSSWLRLRFIWPASHRTVTRPRLARISRTASRTRARLPARLQPAQQQVSQPTDPLPGGQRLQLSHGLLEGARPHLIG
jgi:hypothetical protein